MEMGKDGTNANAEPKKFVKPEAKAGSPAWSQRKFGTPCFSTEFMKRHIGYGAPIITAEGEFTGFDKSAAPTNMSLEVWLGFVPEKYRKVAMEITREIAEDLRATNAQASSESLDKFIATLAKRFEDWHTANA